MFGWWALTMHVLCCAALVPKALVMATPRPLLMAAPWASWLRPVPLRPCRNAHFDGKKMKRHAVVRLRSNG